MPTFFYVYPCAFCDAPLEFRRPTRFDRVFCGIECLAGHESGLRDKVNAVYLPHQKEEG